MPTSMSVPPPVRRMCVLLALLTAASLVGEHPAQAQSVEQLASMTSGEVNVLDRAARLQVEGVMLDQALQALDAHSGVGLIYSPTRLPAGAVSCDCRQLTVRQALDRLLRDTGMNYSPMGEFILIEPQQRTLNREMPVPLSVQGVLAMAAPPASAGAVQFASRPVSFASPVAPEARQGSISGRVVDGLGGQPLGAVQVHIPALSLGVVTGADGAFQLQNVPAGTHQVVAERLGYQRATSQVTVVSGENVPLEFRLQQQALALDQVIVTGTPGGTQRRAIGNVVATISASELTERAPINNMQELLTGRTPGVNFGRQSGNIGTGSAVNVRGISSLSLGQQPLIYVDGVRMQNSTGLGPALRGAGNRQGSALDDLNPDDIESIEVIKGPAAATLYGTEASAGVIQIITKRGAQGAPQFTMSVTQGTNFMRDPSGKFGVQYGTDPVTRELIVGFTAPDGTRYPNVYEYEKNVLGNNPLGYGHNQALNLSARGGTDAIRYFVSGSWSDNTGIVSYNWDERIALRANVTALLSENLSLDVSSGYTVGETSYAQQLSEPGGIWEIMLWGQPALKDTARRGFMRYTPEEIATVEATRNYSRFTASATLSHDFNGWLRQRLIMGIDHSSDENQVLVPRHPQGTASAFGGIGLGEVALDRPVNREATLDYAVSANYRLNDAIGFTTSVGTQYYASERNTLLTRASGLAAPTLRSIAGATSSPFVTQVFVQNKSFGLYVQQEMSLNDRMFFTLAVRGDDNSAFGTEFDAAIYPKASATWVISEENFWTVPHLSTLRFRSALGQAGRQPDSFDAVTLFTPTTGRGGQPAMLPQTFGNPDVGPEVGTEIELGFDYGLLSDRITGEFTYYHQWTHDALANLPLSPSLGFAGSEVVNVGQINNWGWEATANARVVTRPRWAFDLGFTGNHTMNEVIDLGPRPETVNMKVGFPFPIETTHVITSAEFGPLGNAARPINVMCDAGRGKRGLEPGGESVPCSSLSASADRLVIGHRFPSHTWAVDASVSLGQSLQVFALAQGEHGRQGQTTNVWCRFAGCFNNARVANLRDDPIYVESEVFRLVHPNDRTLVSLYDASFWKLRQVGARYQLPANLAQRMRVDRAAISASGNNLWTIWVAEKYILEDVPIPDPELQSVSGLGSDLGAMPGTASFTVRLDLTF